MSAFALAGGGGAPVTLLASAGPGAAAVEAARPDGALVFPEWLLRLQTAMISEDLSVDPRATPLWQWGLTSGSAAALPVRAGGRTIGLLGVVRPEPGAPAEEDVAGLQAVADMLGLALEKERLRESAEEQVRQALMLQQVSRVLASEVEPETVLALIVDAATGLFFLDLCCLLMYDGKGDLRVRVARGLDREAAASLVCPAGLMPDTELFRKMGFSTVAMFRVAGHQQALGYLVAGYRAPQPLDASEQSPLATWASLAGVALENSRRVAELEIAQQDVVDVLVSVLDAQGAAASGLARNRAAYASAVAAHMGLPQWEVRDLYLAALLADVGEVSHGEGAADRTESPRLQRIRQVLRCRHERWDGTGPAGLKGEEIPLASRILGLVAEFAGLLAPGQEGEAPSPEAALVQIKAGSGRAWDPRVIAALEAVVRNTQTLFQPERVQPAKAAPPDRISLLTQREQEILSLVAQGLSNREIASSLFLSEATVKTHVSRILQKLDLPDRTKAAVYALQSKTQPPVRIRD